MKILPLLFTLLVMSPATAQSGEFATSKDGLIYSDSAITKLKHIVDSLNLKFKVCEEKDFYSVLQTKGHRFKLNGPDAVKAKEDIDNGITFEELKRKYPEIIINKDLLVVRHHYKSYKGEDMVSLSDIDFTGEYGFHLDYKNKDFMPVQDWYYFYSEGGKYSKESISGYYFPDCFSYSLMSSKYGKMIQYSECLVDTATTIFFKNSRQKYDMFGLTNKSVGVFIEYANAKLRKPKYIKGYKNNYKDLEAWNKVRWIRADSLMKSDEKFKRLYETTLSEIEKNTDTLGSTNDEFEEYIKRYTSKEKALYLKRNRRVLGTCSMDDSPRVHAVNIAELAAETTKWDIFLRAHLDIMNDRFDRVSDGSYAYAGRKTYIKELEELDINVSDLLLGICLRIEKYSENHYFGDVGRIGRALAESKDRESIQKEILTMIADNNLDDYNRALMYFLYLNYNDSLENESEKRINTKKLKEAVEYLPDYLKSRIVIKS